MNRFYKIFKLIKSNIKEFIFSRGENSRIYHFYLQYWPKKSQRAINQWRRRRKSHRTNKKQLPEIDGLNVVSFLLTAKGIAEAARANIMALRFAKIPYTTIDCGVTIPDNQKVEPLPHSEFGHQFTFNTNLLHINPIELLNLWSHVNKKHLSSLYNIGVWYWELPKFPEDWKFAFDLVDEVWVATQFVYDSVSAVSPHPVTIIPPCIQVNYNASLTRSDFGLPDDRFLFLCAYDVLSYQDRKNPMAAIEAFKRAFPKDDSSVGLVIKTSHTQTDTGRLKELYEAVKGYSNCYFIKETYKKKDFNALIHIVDTYISLHRSEGFGLIPAESMSLGKPVIMTKWSGNLDLMTDNNSCGVDFKLIPIKYTSGPYKTGNIWADPDVDHAASFMKKLVNDRDYYTVISRNAQKTMATDFSIENVSNKIKDRLNQISQERNIL